MMPGNEGFKPNITPEVMRKTIEGYKKENDEPFSEKSQESFGRDERGAEDTIDMLEKGNL